MLSEGLKGRHAYCTSAALAPLYHLPASMSEDGEAWDMLDEQGPDNPPQQPEEVDFEAVEWRWWRLASRLLWRQEHMIPQASSAAPAGSVILSQHEQNQQLKLHKHHVASALLDAIHDRQHHGMCAGRRAWTEQQQGGLLLTATTPPIFVFGLLVVAIGATAYWSVARAFRKREDDDEQQQ